MFITTINPLQKGKMQLNFDQADSLVLYKTEIRQLGLGEQMPIDDSLYEQIYRGIVGKRAIKRAMHLLEKMDRTEMQLRQKLAKNQYPEELIEEAIAYVKSYHYIDDDRYARTFVRLNQDRKSSGRMKMDLLSKGIAKEMIEQALEEENETDPYTLIQNLLEKKQYDPDTATLKEKQKMYRFLLQRGFQAREIMHALHINS